MMTSSFINVKKLHIELQELTSLHGKPTFDTLQKILTQLKENASSIPTNLGGVGHRCIGEILSPTSYHNLVPLAPFIGPTPPGTLTVPAKSIQFVISLLKTQHNKALKTYHIYLLIQRELIHKVLDAVESKYLTRLRNRLTGQVPNNICALFFQLVQAYIKITAKNLWEWYDAVVSMS